MSVKGKVLIEDKEISITEGAAKEEKVEHFIEDTHYVMKTLVTKEVKSSIYTYSDGMKALTSIVSRFGLEYYKVLLFSDNISKAWGLIEVSCSLNVRVKRLSDDVFIVIGYNTGGDDKIMSQYSFCRLMPSTRVEERTINFTRLRGVKFASDHVAIDYDEQETGQMQNVIAKYNFEGKLLSMDTK